MIMSNLLIYLSLFARESRISTMKAFRKEESHKSLYLVQVATLSKTLYATTMSSTPLASQRKVIKGAPF